MDRSSTTGRIVDVDTNPPAATGIVSLVDDDELQIVDERFAHPVPNATVNREIVDVDSMRPLVDVSRPSNFHNADVAIVVDCDEITPVPQSSDGLRNDEIAIVEASVPVQAPKATSCGACAESLPRDALILSRCRHSLCVSCGVRCIVEGASLDFDAPLSATKLRAVPMCVVSRCRAPMSVTDTYNALAPSSVDNHFRDASDAFLVWAEADEESNAIAGPSHIIIPEFTADMATPTFQGDFTERDEDVFGDDFAGAYGPLWLWDKDFFNSGGAAGRWMCAACGDYHSSSIILDGTETKEIDLEYEFSIPDPPLFPHCAYARALGVMESIQRLSQVEENGEKPETKPKNTGKGRSKRYRTAKSVQSSKRRRTTGFAKGTGYAGRSGAEWKGTSAKILAKTARVDAATAFWLARIRCFIVRTDAAPVDSWPCFMRILLRNCKLTEHLSKILINESIMDVGERVPVYVTALRVVAALNDSPSLRHLVGEPCENGRSIASLINSLSNQAALLSAGAGNSVLDARTKLLIKQIRKSIRGIKRHNLLHETYRQNGLELRVSMNPNDYHSLTGPGKHSNREIVGVDNDGEITEENKKRYLDVMKEMQFATVPGLASASSFRSEATKASTSNVGRGQAMRRIVSEVSSLFSSLPLSWSSTILIRVDEDRYDFLRACVLGPEDTPYDSGVFLFDIFLPCTYPQSPPLFKLLTTGGGQVRFNPNLYANGKVCLSLLGTWSGPSWTPASTLLQVLVSIQSLILVPEPFFNEPGLEKQMGTACGKKQSNSYNSTVRCNTARYAILDALRHPYNEFKVAIHAHFRLKRRAVEKVMHNWFDSLKAELALESKAKASPSGSSGAGKSSAPEFGEPSSLATLVQTASAGKVDNVASAFLNGISPVMLGLEGALANFSNMPSAISPAQALSASTDIHAHLESLHRSNGRIPSTSAMLKIVEDIKVELDKLDQANANSV